MNCPMAPFEDDPDDNDDVARGITEGQKARLEALALKAPAQTPLEVGAPVQRGKQVKNTLYTPNSAWWESLAPESGVNAVSDTKVPEPAAIDKTSVAEVIKQMLQGEQAAVARPVRATQAVSAPAWQQPGVKVPKVVAPLITPERIARTETAYATAVAGGIPDVERARVANRAQASAQAGARPSAAFAKADARTAAGAQSGSRVGAIGKGAVSVIATAIAIQQLRAHAAMRFSGPSGDAGRPGRGATAIRGVAGQGYHFNAAAKIEAALGVGGRPNVRTSRDSGQREGVRIQ